MLLFDRAWAGA